MGTPDFAVPALRALLDSEHDIIAVYTAPPKPAGRGKQLRKSAVHEVAEAAGLPLEPSTLPFVPLSLSRDAHRFRGRRSKLLRAPSDAGARCFSVMAWLGRGLRHRRSADA